LWDASAASLHLGAPCYRQTTSSISTSSEATGRAASGYSSPQHGTLWHCLLCSKKEHKVVRLFSNPEGEDGMMPTSCKVFTLDAPAYLMALISDLVCSRPCHGLNAGSCAFWDFICNPTIGYCEHIAFDDNDATFFAGCIKMGYNLEINKHIAIHITYKENNLSPFNGSLDIVKIVPGLGLNLKNGGFNTMSLRS
jgi:hypothetical protein